VGVIWAALYLFQSSRLDHGAREAAYAASVAGAEDSACEAAIATVAAVLGRSHADCHSGDLRMSYDPADEPPTVSITLVGSLPAPPLLDALASGDIEVTQTAVIREDVLGGTPSPSPSP
jgi:hypothetical protein